MIRFLARLRKKLLEGGKLRRYLTYAAGEIILVVAGILIALQVNNWNEARKQEARQYQYLQDLKTEIEQNIQSFDSNYEVLKEMEQGGRYILPFLKNPELEITDSLGFYREFRNSFKSHQTLPEPVTWEEMQNSGNLSLLDNGELVKQIHNYYDNLRSVKEAYDINVRQFVNEGRYFDSEFFSRAVQDDFLEDFEVDIHPGPEVTQKLRNSDFVYRNTNGIISGMMVSQRLLESQKSIALELVKALGAELQQAP